MFSRFRLLVPLVAALFLLAASPAWAHRVNIFAWVDGSDIVVECAFNRSQKVRGGTLNVVDAATNELLLSGRTDDAGVFRFPIPEAARTAGHDLVLRIVAGEGHQNDWIVSASEFVPPKTAAGIANPPASVDGSASQPVHPQSPVKDTSFVPAGATASPAQPTAGQLTAQDVESIVNQALEAKLSPIRRMLSEQYESGPGLRDIIGGLGWIIGLAGIAAYCKRRRDDSR